MNNLSQFFNNVFTAFGNLKFGQLLTFTLCAFGAIFIISLVACIVSGRARAHSKRPFLYAVNVFTALTFCVFATAYSLPYAAISAAFFWCVGYLLYGLLCLFKGGSGVKVKDSKLSAARYEREEYRSPVPEAAPQIKSGVRLEHALSISDKLLLKNLARGDRQEVEKIKTSLTVLKVKDVLTPQEVDQLNNMFNAILKLMAKYDL